MNPNKDFVILSFTFEMVNSRQVGRKLSYHLRKTTTELYSGVDDEVLNDDDFSKVVTMTDRIKNYPVYYVDTAGTVDEIRNTILKFLQESFAKGKWVIVFLDHVLLTNGKQNESERQILADLQRMFISIKKKYKISIIQLSQLNRDIEDKARIMNPQLHFPTRSDLFGSDSIYQASDLVLILNRPELFQIFQYGIEKWPTQNLVYCHLVKNRDGEAKILVFENQLKYNRLEEYDPYSNFLKQQSTN